MSSIFGRKVNVEKSLEEFFSEVTENRNYLWNFGSKKSARKCDAFVITSESKTKFQSADKLISSSLSISVLFLPRQVDSNLRLDMFMAFKTERRKLLIKTLSCSVFLLFFPSLRLDLTTFVITK